MMPSALITGGGSGIGLATAKALAGKGYGIAISGRTEQTLVAARQQIGDALVIAGPLGVAGEASRQLNVAIAHFGKLDVVVNNAGVMTAGSVDDIDLKAVDEMVNTNVNAAFELAYASVRMFKQQGGGHLVNISSIMGTKVQPLSGAYAGTKWAIEALSESLRMELAGTGVKVSCVQPGLTSTSLHRHFEVHPKDRQGIRNPLAPEDVARAIVFLLEQPTHVHIPNIMVLPHEQRL